MPAALATRLSFLAAGFVMACWAPLIPFAKSNVGADEAELGLLLLCLGIGSIIAMPLTGYLSARTGARPMILLGGVGLVAILPMLMMVSETVPLAVILLLFGASLGTIDVAMNVHGAEVERLSPKPLMSGFHAMWSVGGVAGAGGVALALSVGMSPTVAAVMASVITTVFLVIAAPRLLRARAGEPMPFVLPRGIVLVLSALTAITFLVEGAILDWSALLLVARGVTDVSQGGLGYMIFSVAMAIGRLTGDRIGAALGPLRVLFLGGVLMVLGFLPVLLLDRAPGALSGFFMIGLGAANIVPVLFSLAGRQGVMPPGLAIAAVTITGYAGILLGPAMIGFVSDRTNLVTAFWLLIVLAALVPATSRRAVRI